MKIAILIPAYNVEKTIQQVIEKALFFTKDIIVVNDGSLDSTSLIVQKTSAILFEHKTNLGKGMALRTGFKYIIENNYDGVITMDGDGQHNTNELGKFLEAAKDKNANLVIGSRMRNTKAMPFIRFINNYCTSHIISFLIKQKVEDTQSGFRYIKTDLLKKLKLTTKNYDMETEMLVKTALLGIKITSIPIETIYAKETSYYRSFVDSYRIAKVLFKIFLSKYGKLY